VCDRLAHLLRFKLPPNPATDDPIQADDIQETSEPEDDPNSSRMGSTDKLLAKLLVEISDLRRTGIHDEMAMGGEDEIRKDRKLAAAVIDRILFILFVVLFVVETFVFFSIFAFTAHTPFTLTH